MDKIKEPLLLEYAKLWDILRTTNDPIVRDRMNEITMELYAIDRQMAEEDECEDIDE